MGILDFFSKKPDAAIMRLPAGSFTVDCQGQLVISTLPQTYPETVVREIGQLAIATFQAAREARLPLNEFVVDYSMLKLTARALRGGAIVFLSPRSLDPT